VNAVLAADVWAVAGYVALTLAVWTGAAFGLGVLFGRVVRYRDAQAPRDGGNQP
jgi:hypothetical protein